MRRPVLVSIFKWPTPTKDEGDEGEKEKDGRNVARFYAVAWYVALRIVSLGLLAKRRVNVWMRIWLAIDSKSVIAKAMMGVMKNCVKNLC